MDKKILVATMYLKDGVPVKSRKDLTPVGDLKQLANIYSDSGIDKIFVFDIGKLYFGIEPDLFLIYRKPMKNMIKICCVSAN